MFELHKKDYGHKLKLRQELHEEEVILLKKKQRIADVELEIKLKELQKLN